MLAAMPRDDGVAVLFLDAVCCEITGLADHWDDVLCESTAQVLRETATTVAEAEASFRRGADLRPPDYGIWRDLHTELRGSGVELLPVKGLPAA